MIKGTEMREHYLDFKSLLAMYLVEIESKEIINKEALEKIGAILYKMTGEMFDKSLDFAQRQIHKDKGLDINKQRKMLIAFAKHIEKAGNDGSCLTYEQELEKFFNRRGVVNE